jgi:hypothetical protein
MKARFDDLEKSAIIRDLRRVNQDNLQGGLQILLKRRLLRSPELV